MNLDIVSDSDWLRFTMQHQDRWTSATFFSQLDSIMGRIRENLDIKKNSKVVFDLSGLDFIDSSMVTVIVQTVRMTAGNTVCVIAPNNDVYTWLSLLGIDRLVTLFESEEEWRLRHGEKTVNQGN